MESRKRRAFTLVEVLIASLVVAMVTIGAMQMLLKGYEITALSRMKDSARAVLRTYGDQFLRLTTTELVSDRTYTRWLFNPTNGWSSKGLLWKDANGDLVMSDTPTSQGASDDPLIVNLQGDGATGVFATIDRNVMNVKSDDGSASASRASTAAGYQLQATFRATYEFRGKTYVQTLTLLRAVP